MRNFQTLVFIHSRVFALLAVSLLFAGCASVGERYESMGPCARNGLAIGTGSGVVAGLAISGNPFVLGAAQGALGFWLGDRAESNGGCGEGELIVAASAPGPGAPAAEPAEPEGVVYVDATPAAAAAVDSGPIADFASMSEAELERQAETFFTGVYVTVKFDYNTAVLDEPTLRRISEVAAFMQSYPGSEVHVIGHTDGIGTESYNMDLSLQRAAGVANELVERGIPVARVVIEGRGETEPLADNETEEGRAANRRVDITVKPSPTEPTPPTELPPTPAPEVPPASE